MSSLSRTRVSFPGPSHGVKAYLSRPDDGARHPGLVLIHEIWGLTAQIEGVADRFASEGYAVAAPDLMGSDPQLAPIFAPANVVAVKAFMAKLQPGRMRDQVYQQGELAKLPEAERAVVGRFFGVAFGGVLPYARFVDELASTHAYLADQPFVVQGKIGSLGFCFGGGMSAKLACLGKTQACVVFYGQNPDPISLVEKINCPFLGNYGGEDAGLNATLDQLVGAMVKYKKDFEMKIYPGAPHAFFNETSPATYREAAAKEAWERSLRFLDRALKQG
ncbi:MAG: dienelactone hydrolase family protein [Nitrososphaerales archaeon]|jgi:carboxymethylenebutenolidase